MARFSVSIALGGCGGEREKQSFHSASLEDAAVWHYLYWAHLYDCDRVSLEQLASVWSCLAFKADCKGSSLLQIKLTGRDQVSLRVMPVASFKKKDFGFLVAHLATTCSCCLFLSCHADLSSLGFSFKTCIN